MEPAQDSADFYFRQALSLDEQHAATLEARAKVTDKIGVVGFVDWGSIGLDGFSGGFSDSHAGAGLGLRYETGLGPIRLDVASPISGTTGDGVQIYVGLGQSF